MIKLTDILTEINSRTYKIISSDDFNEIYVDESLKKAYFGNEFEQDIVTDIDHYGNGEYWCASFNCIEHYRQNPNYEYEREINLPPGLKIAIGSEDDFYEYEKEIRSKADGFYNPEMDTFGLILFNK